MLDHGVIADVSHEQREHHLRLLPDISTAIFKGGIEWSNDGSHLGGGKLARCWELLLKPAEKLYGRYRIEQNFLCLPVINVVLKW